MISTGVQKLLQAGAVEKGSPINFPIKTIEELEEIERKLNEENSEMLNNKMVINF